MKNLSVMLKPASSLCNLRCSYCFYADIASIREVHSFGIMKEDTTRAILENVRSCLAPGDRIQFAFQGGEPTIAGLSYFREFSSIVDQWDKRIRVSYALQTNGTLLDEEWVRYLKQYDYLVGISLDILPQNHNSFRKDAEGEGTYQQVLGAVKLLERFGVEYNILCTLTNQAARNPQQMWKELVRRDFRFVQFTPCLGDLEGSGESAYALMPRRFAKFYNALFRLWYEDFSKGRYRSIKFFDDVVNLMLFGIPTSCGMNGHCQPQLVVEADGSAYPCDFYCLPEYSLGDLARESLESLLSSPRASEFVHRPHTQPRLCEGCPYRKFCGGGCKRMQKEICCGENDDFCGYRYFLDTNMRQLQAIVQEQKRRRGMR